MKVQSLNRFENIVAKRRNCLLLSISPLGMLFSEVVCCRGVRKRLYVGKDEQTYDGRLQINGEAIHHIYDMQTL